MVFWLALMFNFGALVYCNDQPVLTVEVLKAETIHWTTYWYSPGSPSHTDTDCTIYDTSTSCTSTTTGGDPASSTPIYHKQVNLSVMMPDGNVVAMQCHIPPIWSVCFQPNLGVYSAKVNGHNIRLMVPVLKGKPKYNKDGTVQKSAKTGMMEVKFSFR